LSLLLLLFPASCSRRAKIETDAFAPRLRWGIYNVETRTTLMVSDSGGPISIHPGSRVFVSLIGEDLSGIYKLSLSGNALQRCRGTDGREPVSSQTIVGFKTDEARAADAAISLALFREVDMTWRCQDGWRYSDGQVTLSAEGENRSGKKTGATLTLTRPD
jgi:hypothetical protein